MATETVADGRHPQGAVDRTARTSGARPGRGTGRTSTCRRSTPCLVDTRGGSDPAVLAGAASSWVGPQVRLLRRPRRQLGARPGRRDPLPRRHRRVRRADLAARSPASTTTWCGRAPSRAPSGAPTTAGETFTLERALWDHPHRPEWGAGFGGQAFHTLLPHPTDAKSLTVAISTGGVYQTTDGGGSWSPRNQGIRAEFLPEGAAVPRVRAVRAQGRPPPVATRAALRPEPRRRLPLRRRGRLVDLHRRRAPVRLRLPGRRRPARRPTPSTSSRSRAPTAATRPRARPGSGGPATPATPGRRWEPATRACPTVSSSA